MHVLYFNFLPSVSATESLQPSILPLLTWVSVCLPKIGALGFKDDR